MKRRAAAKGKSMYVIFGLLVILLGSLAYLTLQKGQREGLDNKTKNVQNDEKAPSKPLDKKENTSNTKKALKPTKYDSTINVEKVEKPPPLMNPSKNKS